MIIPKAQIPTSRKPLLWSLETQTTKQTQQLHTELGGVQELLQLGIFTISRHIELGGVQELSQLDSPHNALTQVAIRSHTTTKSWAANCSGIFWQYYLQMISRCKPTRSRKNLSTIISFSSRMLFLPNSERLNCTLSFGRSRLQAVEVLLLFTELGVASVLY